MSLYSAAYQLSKSGVGPEDDLTAFKNISDDIVSTLRQRFLSDTIYTSLGSNALVTLDPHKYVASNSAFGLRVRPVRGMTAAWLLPTPGTIAEKGSQEIVGLVWRFDYPKSSLLNTKQTSFISSLATNPGIWHAMTDNMAKPWAGDKEDECRVIIWSFCVEIL